MPRPDPGRRGSGPGRSRRPGDGFRYARSSYRLRVRPEARAGAAGPAVGDTAGRRSAARSSALTGRAAVLGLVVCALVLSLAYPAKQYLGQRGALAELTRQQVAAEQRVAVLQAQARQLQDPDYLRAQARKRLQYVLPGDTVYEVINPDDQPAAPAGSGTAPGSDPSQPWYVQLWRSVQSAESAASSGAP